MMALIMAGGRGSRMKADTEKLLLEYEKPMILHVVDALKSSGSFGVIAAATSANAPLTRQLLRDSGVQTIDTAGAGYAQDLGEALRQISDDVFVVSGDMPLLDGEIIGKMLSHSGHVWTSFVVSCDFLDSVGFAGEFFVTVNGKKCAYSGVSLVDARKITSESVTEHYEIVDDRRIAFNLNTKREYDLLGGS